MINVGIITGCRRKKTDFKISTAEINIIPAYLKKKDNFKKLDKIRKSLFSKGCDYILKENLLKNEKETKNVAEYEKILTFNLFQDIYNKYLPELNLKEHRLKILIKDKDAVIFNSKKMLDLCDKTFRLSVITDNIEMVNKLSEKIFEESGAFLYIKDTDESRGEDVIFDVDEKVLRIKSDIFINEIVFEDNLIPDFDISIFEWAEILKKAGLETKLERINGNKAYFKLN